MPRLTKPSMKQKQFARAYVKNKFNGKKSALEVYDVKEKSAKQQAFETLKNPMVQNEIQKAMASAGLTQEYLNETMFNAIETNKQGKPSQAVLAQLLIQGQKIYSYLPKDSKTIVRQEKKVLLSKDFNILKEELSQTITTTQALLADL